MRGLARVFWPINRTNASVVMRESSSLIPKQDPRLRSVKRELEMRFTPFCFGLEPTVVDAVKKVDADYSLTSAMEIYRANQGQFARPDDAAKAIIQGASEGLREMCQLSQAKFYVNATLTERFIGHQVSLILSGIAPFALEREPRRVVIDYSSPNIAKQMHVGHLRSTLIGNSIAHLREFMGDEVVRVNHLGDWGTQFGTLLQQMREVWGDADLLTKIDAESLDGITRLYQDAKQRFDADLQFRDKAKLCTVHVQSGNHPLLTRAWKQLVHVSLNDFNRLYARLGVWQDPSWFLGESFYQNKITGAIEELSSFVSRQAEPSQAVLLYTGLPEAKVPPSKPGELPTEIPLILKKSDGGVGYDATDVAALRYRLVNLRADEVIYVTDNGQSLHFQLVFHCAKLAKWLGLGQSLTHVAFGIVTKEQGGRIRTREGNIQTLDSLLNKAVERMKLVLRSKRATWTASELDTLNALAEPLGVFCVAFSELRTTRTSDYEFNVDKMCNPDGNSGLFVVHCIRKANLVLQRQSRDERLPLNYSGGSASARERALACELLRVHEVMEQSAATFSPHILAAHLLNVAAKLSSFIDDAKLLTPQSSSAAKQSDHLALVRASDVVMRHHVQLLGMHALLKRCEPHIQEINTWTNADALI